MLLFGLLGCFFVVVLIYLIIYILTNDSSKQKDTTEQDYPYTKKNKF